MIQPLQETGYTFCRSLVHHILQSCCMLRRWRGTSNAATSSSPRPVSNSHARATLCNLLPVKSSTKRQRFFRQPAFGSGYAGLGDGSNPPIQNSIRGAGDGAEESISSPNGCRIPLRIVGKVAKCVFPTVPEDQLDRIRQARSGLLFRVALTVGSRYFRTVYDIPRIIHTLHGAQGDNATTD